MLRIFDDMVQSGRLAEMADGLQILGQSVHELVCNYVEVLNKVDAFNLTFKPSTAIMCPQNITLFGWDLRGQTWFPRSHTVSALVHAKKPTTVKQF